MVDDFGECWPAERMRRYGLALAYHDYVCRAEGMDARSWLEHYQTALAENDLAAAFGLIYHQVAPISRSRWESHRGVRFFPTARRPGGTRCQSFLVWGYNCPIHASAAELELDHSWPFALGGRSVPSNGIWLCKLHNRAKSHDVHNFEWPEVWPSWLMMMLAAIKFDCAQAATY